MKIFFYLISILLILFPLKQAKRYRCGADELKLHPYNIEPTKEEEEEKRRKLETDYTPIKIFMDYTSFIKPDDMTSSIFDNIKNTIEDTLNEFKKFLLIQHVNVDLSGQL